MSKEFPALVELQRMIGMKGEPVQVEIDRSFVRRFCDAIGDKNPLWQDEKQSGSSSSERTVVPPGLLCTARLTGITVGAPSVPFPPQGVDGGATWEWHAPIYIGDTLTAVMSFADVYEREGKTGKMIFMVFEKALKNHEDTLVATYRGTVIGRL